MVLFGGGWGLVRPRKKSEPGTRPLPFVRRRRFTAAAAVFTASVVFYNVCVCVCVAVLCRFTSPVTSHVYEQC